MVIPFTQRRRVSWLPGAVRVFRCDRRRTHLYWTYPHSLGYITSHRPSGAPSRGPLALRRYLIAG
jgi:hypothetical protein